MISDGGVKYEYQEINVWVCQCKQRFYDDMELYYHQTEMDNIGETANHGNSWVETEYRVVNTIQLNPVYETQKQIVGYKCSCGATK